MKWRGKANGKAQKPLDGVYVCILVPTLTCSVSSEFDDSLRSAEKLIAAYGGDGRTIKLGKDPYLAKVRNKLATRVLDEIPEATDIFWWDDDVGAEPQAVIRMLLRPEEVVAGIYPKKESFLDFPCAMLKDAATGDYIWHQGLLAADMVPTGFLRWKRSVLEKMAALRPRYLDIIKGEQKWFAEIFRTGVLWPDRQWYGEDPAFCREWREMGGDIWVDPDIKFSHRGTHLWEAKLADHLETGFKNIVKPPEPVEPPHSALVNPGAPAPA